MKYHVEIQLRSDIATLFNTKDLEMTKTTSLEIVNKLDKNQFVSVLGEIYERSLWVADQVFEQKPFNSLTELNDAMISVVANSSVEERLALLRAHPELAGKEAQEGNLTGASTAEQSSAGLNALTKEEMAHVAKLNSQYQAKFGFPFIIAVKNHTKSSIFSQWATRLDNTPDQEFETCLGQVYEIARIRLDALITS